MNPKYISLSNKNLRSYLFDGVLSRTNEIDGPYFYHFIRLNYLIKATYAYFFLKNKIPKFLNEEKIAHTEVLIIGHHYALDFANLEKHKKITIIGLINEYELAKKNNWGFINACEIYINLGTISWKKPIISVKLINSITRLENLIIKCINIKKVYVNADLLPFYRACLLVFTKLKHVKIICPQHGLYTSCERKGETEGALADINICFDDTQKLFLIKSGINPDTIIIKDYKLSDEKKLNPNLINNKDVLIVSDGYHILLGFNTYKYYFYLIKLWMFCKKNGYNPIIRPHPSEKILFKLLFFLKTDKLPLISSMNKYDVFIACGSSVLRQAKNKGKVSIQMDQDFYNNIIRMDKVGYANYFCSFNNLLDVLKSLRN